LNIEHSKPNHLSAQGTVNPSFLFSLFGAQTEARALPSFAHMAYHLIDVPATNSPLRPQKTEEGGTEARAAEAVEVGD